MSARADIAEAYITIVYFLKDTTMGKEKCLNLVIVQNGNCGMESAQNKARSKAFRTKRGQKPRSVWTTDFRRQLKGTSAVSIIDSVIT